VEVSVDGGNTWHPAEGRESWAYTGPAGGQPISRATDDSANLEGTSPGGPGTPPGGGGSPPGGGGTPPGQTPPAQTLPPGTTKPPGKPKPPSGTSGRDATAPKVRITRRRVRVSVGGYLALRLSCPRGERSCRVGLKLRHGRATVARKTFTVRGGKTREVALRLTRTGRRALARSSSLRVLAAVSARDAAGNRASSKTRLRLLAGRP
jgi:hypothetical protein